MTTDTFPKLRSRVFTIRGVEYRMAGGGQRCRNDTPGHGTRLHHLPFHPNSPTACHITGVYRNAVMSPRSLQSALTYAVDRSFNSISVDGDMSTNDSIYIFANGAAVPTGQDHLLMRRTQNLQRCLDRFCPGSSKVDCSRWRRCHKICDSHRQGCSLLSL